MSVKERVEEMRANDVFFEQLVKKEMTTATKIKKIGIIIGALVLIVVAGMIPYVSLLVMAGVIWLAYYLFIRLNIEYEYIFTNGTLDIDCIYNKAKRKRLLSVEVKDFQSMVKITAERLGQKERQAEKRLDYTSGNGEGPFYQCLYVDGGQRTTLLIEPNDKLLKGIKGYRRVEE